MAREDDIAGPRARFEPREWGGRCHHGNAATSSLLAYLRRTANGLRQAAYHQPLVVLLISFEVGFALEWIGRPYASR